MKKGFRWIPALVILILTMLFSAAAITLASKPGKGMERKGS